jgi:hypothetical protein
MERNIQKITAIILFAIICFSLSLGLLYEPKIQALTPEITDSTLSLEHSNPIDAIFTTNSDITRNFKGIENNHYIDSATNDVIQTSNDDQTDQSLFQVTTEYGYICNTGDPTEAIQNALDSLPDKRTEPCNVYLQGVFSPMLSVIMEGNVNFIGNQATLISKSQLPIFINNWEKNYSETFGPTFFIDGKAYQDWITLHNVTFQSIHFQQLVTYGNQYSSAIYFYDGNSTGWGISDNLSVYYCQFEGFYNCIQGLAINSNYIGNNFHNYQNNAIMFPAGYTLIFRDNIFDTPTNELTVEQYQERDGQMSIQGGIGLFFMDINGDVLIINNVFKQGINSTGITFSSSCGNFTVTGNVFSGQGDVYSADIFPRPWLSSGIKFYDNIGAADSYYDRGNYSSFKLNSN